MSRKKLIKQLMAVGISRNDATAFVRTYRKVKDTGMDRLFHMMEMPPEPVIRTRTVRPERLRVKYTIDKYEMENRGAIDWDAYMEDRLIRQLAQRLKDSGVVCFYKRATPLWTEFYAETNVLPPDVQEARES